MEGGDGGLDGGAEVSDGGLFALEGAQARGGGCVGEEGEALVFDGAWGFVVGLCEDGGGFVEADASRRGDAAVLVDAAALQEAREDAGAEGAFAAAAVVGDGDEGESGVEEGFGEWGGGEGEGDGFEEAAGGEDACEFAVCAF